MKNMTSDFEQIEQELQELRSRFSGADKVLKELEEIQIEFEDLAETHKKLKEYVSEVSQFNAESSEIIRMLQDAHRSFEERFTQLREDNQIKVENLEGQLSEDRNQLNSHESQIQELKSSLNLVKTSFHNTNHSLVQQNKILKRISSFFAVLCVSLMVWLWLSR